jgi:hypothetical protein
VTVTVTPSSGITATPTTLAFTPTVFSGTVTVSSTATPGTTGTVKFSAPGYADGVVNVTVDQSTNLVVKPASLSIPANGAASFTVKLAKAPTAPVTVTVTTSTPDLTTTPASLTFTPATFNIDQPVSVRAELRAAPGTQASVLLDAGPLGQFKLPVTITSLSNTTFFIDPTFGNDNFPGTAAQPWQTVAAVLQTTQNPGLTVAAAANAGNNVVVTILSGGTENVGVAVNTPALSAGSVTVLQDPSPRTFTLNMGANQLTLDKGYKLQDIRIESTVSAATGATAVLIKHPTAGLASVDVECKVAVNNTAVKCVEVQGAGSHILRDVRVDVSDARGVDGGGSPVPSIGILNNDASVNLTIVGGRVRPIDPAAGVTRGAVKLIDSKGVLTVTDLTVDMTHRGHAKASTGIVIRAARSSVTNSTIKVNDDATGGNATGIDVQAGPSTVANNNFIGFGPNTIGINGATRLSADSVGNNFSGRFGAEIQ